MKFLGMGVPELLIILAVILLIFGPKNLPKLGNALGRTVKNIRQGMDDDKSGDNVAAAEIESTSDDDDADIDEITQAKQAKAQKEDAKTE